MRNEIYSFSTNGSFLRLYPGKVPLTPEEEATAPHAHPLNASSPTPTQRVRKRRDSGCLISKFRLHVASGSFWAHLSKPFNST